MMEIGLRGFARGSGNTNSCLAELSALRDGLNSAFDLGILYLIVEIVALSIVQIMKNFVPNHHLDPLQTNFRNLLMGMRPGLRLITSTEKPTNMLMHWQNLALI